MAKLNKLPRVASDEPGSDPWPDSKVYIVFIFQNLFSFYNFYHGGYGRWGATRKSHGLNVCIPWWVSVGPTGSAQVPGLLNIEPALPHTAACSFCELFLVSVWVFDLKKKYLLISEGTGRTRAFCWGNKRKIRSSTGETRGCGQRCAQSCTRKSQRPLWGTCFLLLLDHPPQGRSHVENPRILLLATQMHL